MTALAAQYRTPTVLAMLRSWADVNFAPDWETLPILADALEDAGYAVARKLQAMRNCEGDRWGAEEFKDAVVPQELCDGDWSYVFAYAGELPKGDAEKKVWAAPPGTEIPLNGFSRWDVAEVYGTSDGENDERNWLCYGRLHDGRFFFVTAGCDYTGWG